MNNRRLWIKVLAFLAAVYVSYTGTRHLAQLHHEQAAAAYTAQQTNQLNQQISTAANTAATEPASLNATVFVDHQEAQGSGIVIKVLADAAATENGDGSRHQRFILRLSSGQTVLVVHNIDLAPRIDGLAVGDTVEFKGIFINKDKGGLIHWTHHDPEGKHEGGWLKRNGHFYQ